MGKTYEALNDRLIEFIKQQQVFFVASAPLDSSGHVNVSPKGVQDTFAILDPATVAYVDFTGSGAETIAHARENGRIVVMFCAFSGPPRIVRIHGRAELITEQHREFSELASHFGSTTGARGILRIRAQRISDSCGYGVPLYSFVGHREQLPKWIQAKGPEGIKTYQEEHNRESIDGLPSLPPRDKS